MTYTAENMIDLLGAEATDDDAEKFAAFLLSEGWSLDEVDGQIRASKDDELMTESEWSRALEECFNS